MVLALFYAALSWLVVAAFQRWADRAPRDPSKEPIDERPLVRFVGVCSGVLGGGGAALYQHAISRSCSDTPCALVSLLLVMCATLVLSMAAGLVVVVVSMVVRSKRREWLAPLYVVLPFVLALYLFGGRWPFWTPRMLM